MPLPIPNLDNSTWEEMLKEIKALEKKLAGLVKKEKKLLIIMQDLKDMIIGLMNLLSKDGIIFYVKSVKKEAIINYQSVLLI